MESLDFLDLQSEFSSEEKLAQESVRRFVSKEVMPLLKEAHRKERFPEELIPRFGDLGLLGANLSGYSCPGLGEVTYGLMMRELEAADSGIRSFCSVQSSLVMWAIYTYGSEDQKNEWLPTMAKGHKIGAFALTEPGAGSDPGAMKCRAQKTDGGYLLNGQKAWITNGSIADAIVVWAREAKEEGRIAGFILRKGQRGLRAMDMEGKLSLRISRTAQLELDDCFVPDSDCLPLAQGLKAPLSCLSQARYGIVWGALGAATNCYQTALEYAKNRKVFSKQLSEYQLVQAKLVHAAQEITKGELLALRLGRLKEKGTLRPEQISLGKMNNCKIALEIARNCRDILGANGIMDDYPIMRHLMNLETVNTYEGTEDIHRLVIGQSLTGHPAFR